MSGIAGIIRFDGGPVEPGLVEKMTASMSYRGPDGINHWVQGSVALGQCMLRTTPESLEETQPLLNDDGSLVLVMDGRVDNWEELRVELLSRGARLRTRADAELVLRAYEVWGNDCVTHIDGDFAFVIWNARTREAFCARDRMGVRPLLYVARQTYVAFASDDDAFIGLPGVSGRINEDRIAWVLAPDFDGVGFHDSWLEGISKLPASNTMTVRPSGDIRISLYYTLEPRAESRFGSDAECEEAFRDVFCAAMRRRLRCVQNPALMLSGGIDSAAIAGTARHVLAAQSSLALETFSVVSEDANTCNETRNIRSIIAGNERRAHLLTLPSLHGSVTDADLARAAFDRPHPQSSTILLPAMMHLTAFRNGNRVMLDGVDGDLATYQPERFFAFLLHAGRWREGWTHCQQASLNNTYLRQRSPALQMALGTWDVLATPQMRRAKDTALQLVGHGPGNTMSVIHPDFARRIRLYERLREHRTLPDPGRMRNLQERHIRALMPIGLPYSMEKFNLGAARYGIESRHPWSDRQLLEFYVRLSLHDRTRNGWTKHLVRRATAPWLQHGVRWNKGKEHLGRKVILRMINGNRDRVLDLVRGRSGEKLREFVHPKWYSSVLKKFEAEADGLSSDTFDGIFPVMTVAAWHHRYDVV